MNEMEMFAPRISKARQVPIPSGTPVDKRTGISHAPSLYFIGASSPCYFPILMASKRGRVRAGPLADEPKKSCEPNPPAENQRWTARSCLGQLKALLSEDESPGWRQTSGPRASFNLMSLWTGFSMEISSSPTTPPPPQTATMNTSRQAKQGQPVQQPQKQNAGALTITTSAVPQNLAIPGYLASRPACIHLAQQVTATQRGKLENTRCSLDTPGCAVSGIKHGVASG